MRRLLLQQFNKKGDIPITFLVIGVFAVCTLVLLNFYVTGIGDEGIFEGVSLVLEVGKFANDIQFYQNLEVDALESAESSRLSNNKDIEINASMSGDKYTINGDLTKKDYLFFNERRIAYIEYKFEP